MACAVSKVKSLFASDAYFWRSTAIEAIDLLAFDASRLIEKEALMARCADWCVSEKARPAKSYAIDTDPKVICSRRFAFEAISESITLEAVCLALDYESSVCKIQCALTIDENAFFLQ